MSKAVAITVAVIIAILLIGYLIFMYEAFIKSRWIFKPNYPVGPGDNPCHPLINVSPITDTSALKANLQKAQAASS